MKIPTDEERKAIVEDLYSIKLAFGLEERIFTAVLMGAASAEANSVGMTKEQFLILANSVWKK